jgi:ATP-binding cassette subfamily C protein
MLPAFALTRELRDQARAAAEPTATATATATTTAPRLDSELRLQQVSFRHGADGPATLADIDLAIAARSTTALIGPSGAGKTTLADLLLGLTAPDTGTLLVDGVPLAGGQRRDWRHAAGYVPQDTFLFPGTVRENLCWATQDGAEADLWQALELAAAADFVRRLPQGLDTPVGERGMRLSGGERQRIALARALLRRPQLLVLDEATSHLDSENENLIQRALEHLHGKLTLVVIAHRLSTVRHADRIVVIEGGRIVEAGDWAALVQHGGRFREILDASLAA